MTNKTFRRLIGCLALTIIILFIFDAVDRHKKEVDYAWKEGFEFGKLWSQTNYLPSIIEQQTILVDKRGYKIKIDGLINTCKPEGSETINAIDKETIKREAFEIMIGWNK